MAKNHSRRTAPAVNETQTEHNRHLSGFAGQTVKSVRLLTLEGGSLPDGVPYDGAGFLLETGTASVLVVPGSDRHLRFYIAGCQDHPLPVEPPEVTALHACDWLEAECLMNESQVSRFRGQKSTVYVALTPAARAAFDRLYETESQR